MTGFLGGFTTVSTFSLETFSLIESKRWGIAIANIFGTCGLCFLGVYLGQEVMGRLLLFLS
jgi:CrcB protein